jgi:hypothetical protein
VEVWDALVAEAGRRIFTSSVRGRRARLYDQCDSTINKSRFCFFNGVQVFGVLSKPFPGLVFHVTKMLTNVSAVV